jgi:hypothetical protein
MADKKQTLGSLSPADLETLIRRVVREEISRLLQQPARSILDDWKIVSPAQTEIKELPGNVRAQARQRIRALGEDPHPPRSKELRNKPGIYRGSLGAAESPTG